MDTVESSGALPAAEKTPGFMTWLRELLFGAGGQSLDANIHPAGTRIDEETYVIAPGGYRIRVPQVVDVGHCVGEMVPAVREGLSQLPPLPHIVNELLREIQDPNSSAASVAEIVSSDPALTASLIRTVNSASVGLTRNITSISEVVSFLGFGIIRSMVIRLRLNEILVAKTEQDAQDMEDLWVHSLAVSYAATQLALRVPDVDGGFVATLGLLHDIGKMALLAQLPEQAAALRQKMQTDPAVNPLVHEAQLLGIDHAGLGANLAAVWQLPPDLIQAIRRHHHFIEPFHSTDPLALHKALHVVQIANQLAKYCYTHIDCVEVDAIPDDVFELLGLEPSLPKLLDDKMRGAIGRAIFFAEANSQHAIARPGRFLRPLSEAAARELLNAAPSGELRVDQDDAAIAAMFSAHVPALDDTAVDNNEIPSIARSIAHARLSCPAAQAAVEKCIRTVCGLQNGMNLSTDTRSAAAILIRSLLPNLKQISARNELMEVAQGFKDGKVTLAIRAPAMAMARRLGASPVTVPDAARRLAEADLANVLNLGWFHRVCISADGSAMMFELK